MGRMLKNTVARTGSHALGVPTGTSSIGPNPSTYGQMQYQTDANKMVYWGSNSAGTYGYYNVAHEGAVQIKVDKFTGNNAGSTFGPLTNNYYAGQEAQVLVFLNAVWQVPGLNYTFANANPNAITFTSTPGVLANIYVLHNFNSTITY